MPKDEGAAVAPKDKEADAAPKDEGAGVTPDATSTVNGKSAEKQSETLSSGTHEKDNTADGETGGGGAAQL